MYNSLDGAIFSNNNRKWKRQDGKYKASTLENKVQELVSEKNPGEFMIDSWESEYSSKGKAFVCAMPAGNLAQPQRFRTYPVRESASANCKIWEAARATTADPTFFKRIALSREGHVKEEFVGAGVDVIIPATK
ncbi:hypothetical protein K469DRAFT_713802 [Zopfia rhizophila CBS 207.26]|uniref:Uncharacterized protein n=1 Tax=Zopfia rhizophila CBS 207.26 TaxID=1314779 RepID=A0A6A6DP51_9PEZI|nr:hypothetical protein K469DRAFT_713802 [Zopfia rhizophila CBS 207.26]